MTAAQAAAWGATGDHSPLMDNYGSPTRLFVKGSGAELYDADGTRHLDFLCGLAVTGLGHAHPAITRPLRPRRARSRTRRTCSPTDIRRPSPKPSTG